MRGKDLEVSRRQTIFQEETGLGFWGKLSHVNGMAAGTSWIKCSKLAPAAAGMAG
jgi:hypothetical protein